MEQTQQRGKTPSSQESEAEPRLIKAWGPRAWSMKIPTTHIHIHTNTHKPKHTHTCIHTNTHTQAYTHTQTPVSGESQEAPSLGMVCRAMQESQTTLPDYVSIATRGAQSL